MSLDRPILPSARQSPDYYADGQNKTFGFSFPIFDAADLLVLISQGGVDFDQSLSRSLGYTISGVNNPSGGTVVFSAAPPSGTIVRLLGQRTPSRLTSVVNAGVVRSPALESDLDQIIAVQQEFRRDIDNIVGRPILRFDAAGPFSARGNYDAASAGFSYQVLDDALNRVIFYVKKTNSPGDWSPPQILTGGAQSIPAGSVIYIASTVPPNGFFKANGAWVSRATYAALFFAIGTTFGAGDGSTTFSLPDLRGQFVRGWSDGTVVDPGRVFGSWQNHQFEDHYHKTNITGTTGATIAQFNYIGPGLDNATNVYTTWAAVGSRGAETRPCNVALLACIKY